VIENRAEYPIMLFCLFAILPVRQQVDFLANCAITSESWQPDVHDAARPMFLQDPCVENAFYH